MIRSVEPSSSGVGFFLVEDSRRVQFTRAHHTQSSSMCLTAPGSMMNAAFPPLLMLCTYTRLQPLPIQDYNPYPPPPCAWFDCGLFLSDWGPVMQSLLSTIHSSLSQTRSAFALRVFVSYDALGRCKQSVVVDIEQPRPPTKHAPLYTIRLLSPAAPLSAATRSATAPLAPATPPSANPPNRTASSPSDTALSPPPPTSHTTQSTSAL